MVTIMKRNMVTEMVTERKIDFDLCRYKGGYKSNPFLFSSGRMIILRKLNFAL